jgi:hypothetical protein
MHGETVKFGGVQQARPYNIYKKTKLKLLKANAAIWFSKKTHRTNACMLLHYHVHHM